MLNIKDICTSMIVCIYVFPFAVSPEFSVIAVVDDFNTTNGSSVSFTCSALGGPDNVFVWMLTDSSTEIQNTSVIPPLNVSEVVGFLQEIYPVVQHSNHGNYTIDSVNATENGGTYTCVVINVAGLDSDEVELLVQPIITRQPENVLTSNGKVISLSCEADGYPPPTYSWFLETTEHIILVTEDAPRVTLDSDGKSLNFMNTDYSDGGAYFCTAISLSGYVDSRPAMVTGTYTTQTQILYFSLC